jgi:hypothetical protein
LFAWQKRKHNFNKLLFYTCAAMKAVCNGIRCMARGRAAAIDTDLAKCCGTQAAFVRILGALVLIVIVSI